MDLSQAVGTAVRIARLSKAMRQEALGASQTYVSDVERGLKAPSLEKLEEMALAMGIHPVSLVLASYLVKEAPTSTETLINRLRCDLAGMSGFDELAGGTRAEAE
ncbi:helix-turn-helix domain-containing protein [Pseudomonas sp. MOB-449]|nr:helix-turn-helix domain-containing protein [Pseudomonas sp. MOB-449]